MLKITVVQPDYYIGKAPDVRGDDFINNGLCPEAFV